MIIGFTGVRGSGKSTGAAYIQSSWSMIRMAFADAIKQGAMAKFGLIEDQVYGRAKEEIDPVLGVTPRRVLQLEGTEFGRYVYGNDIWVRILKRKVDRHRYKHVVIEDVRFQNEADAIREWGGFVIGLTRGIAESVDPHASEQYVRDHLFDLADIVIDNALMDISDYHHALYTVLEDRAEFIARGV